jgi:hypothetical protein
MLREALADQLMNLPMSLRRSLIQQSAQDILRDLPPEFFHSISSDDVDFRVAAEASMPEILRSWQAVFGMMFTCIDIVDQKREFDIQARRAMAQKLIAGILRRLPSKAVQRINQRLPELTPRHKVSAQLAAHDVVDRLQSETDALVDQLVSNPMAAIPNELSDSEIEEISASVQWALDKDRAGYAAVLSEFPHSVKETLYEILASRSTEKERRLFGSLLVPVLVLWEESASQAT